MELTKTSPGAPLALRLNGTLLALLSLLILRGLAVGQQLPTFGENGSHDPSALIKSGTTYYVYSDGIGISCISSSDLQNWNTGSSVFTSGTPAWIMTAVPG